MVIGLEIRIVDPPTYSVILTAQAVFLEDAVSIWNSAMTTMMMINKTKRVSYALCD